MKIKIQKMHYSKKIKAIKIKTVKKKHPSITAPMGSALLIFFVIVLIILV